MLHVVLDTSIYSGDFKRRKGPFRALDRLCKGRKAQLHIPHYVKHEFVSQQYIKIREALKDIREATEGISKATDHEELAKYAKTTKEKAIEVRDTATDRLMDDFNAWMKAVHAIEYPVAPSHAARVTDDYFKGAPPFKSVKNRNDFPDSFIWHTICDIAQKQKPLHVVAEDRGMHKAACGVKSMTAHGTLEAFINTKECQQALDQLTEEVVTRNVKRAVGLLSTVETSLREMIGTDIINAIHGKTVTSDSIPDDNNEAMILGVYTPHAVSFDFEKVDNYGEGELGVPFEVSVECDVNYAIFKADYFLLSEEKMKRISIGERNEHYFDADENYVVDAQGVLSLKLDIEMLKRDKVTDDEVRDAIKAADSDLEIDEVEIAEAETGEGEY